MAFLHRDKKKEESADKGFSMDDFSQPPAQQSVPPPIEQVLSLRQQGYADDQISQYLQQQGYGNSSINEAMSQAPTSQQNFQQQPQQYQQPSQQIGEDEIQQFVEQILNEKWADISKELKSVIDWKEISQSKIVQLQQQIDDIRNDMQSVKTALLGKITEYDKNISTVGTEIKAMEKVFQNVLPSLTESVNKLDRISKAGISPVKFSKK